MKYAIKHIESNQFLTKDKNLDTLDKCRLYSTIAGAKSALSQYDIEYCDYQIVGIKLVPEIENEAITRLIKSNVPYIERPKELR